MNTCIKVYRVVRQGHSFPQAIKTVQYATPPSFRIIPLTQWVTCLGMDDLLRDSRVMDSLLGAVPGEAVAAPPELE